MARRLLLLHYEYVPDMLERRDPHRPAHLEHVRAWHRDGRLLVAGATGDPPTGALFVLDVTDGDIARAFVLDDPYEAAGLVTSWRTEPWAVVAGQLGPERAEFTVDLRHEDHRVLVMPRGELDVSTVPALREVLEQLRDRDEPSTLDLGELEFIDSSGLRLLLDLAGRGRGGWDVRLRRGRPRVHRLFELTLTVDRLPFEDG